MQWAQHSDLLHRVHFLARCESGEVQYCRWICKLKLCKTQVKLCSVVEETVAVSIYSYFHTRTLQGQYVGWQLQSYRRGSSVSVHRGDRAALLEAKLHFLPYGYSRNCSSSSLFFLSCTLLWLPWFFYLILPRTFHSAHLLNETSVHRLSSSLGGPSLAYTFFSFS